ncbi:unnamed protein product [Plutella xylostella]|uniref:(diamondback moth) hypothetical protein n=1 Tax=Plutella xylostella TaxID=51655 RepID=A0A8S4FHF9_PLUXY|nr:unnamed protein product [Plutella xylostella]
MRLSTALLCCLVLGAAPAPVRRTLNFNMFVLKPQPDNPDRVLISTNGVSRFGPLLEYLVQRVQGLLSVRVHPDEIPDAAPAEEVPVADTAENEVEGLHEARLPGVVVRPSRTKPGTYEVQMAVVLDDGKPGDQKNKDKPEQSN